MSKGFTVYLTNGVGLSFPDAADSAPAVVRWLRTARPDEVLTLDTDTGTTTHVQKRHITHIVVDQ